MRLFTSIILVLFMMTSTSLAAEQCGTKKTSIDKRQKWMLNKPCSIIVSAQFLALIKLGVVGDYLNQILEFKRDIENMLNSDCLGVDKLINKHLLKDQPISVRATSRIYDPKIDMKIRSNQREIDKLVRDAVKSIYGK